MSNILQNHEQVLHLQNEGYQVNCLPAHVVIGGIPYVDATGAVQDGKFIIPVTFSGDRVSLQDHQMDFMGLYPHKADGSSLVGLLSNTTTTNSIDDGVTSNFRFSNHPVDDDLKDIYRKVKHYEAIICSEAQLVNPEATARLFRPPKYHAESVFKYADTNASRAGIYEQVNRMRKQKVAIIGLGGTGSYVLDMVAKTAVKEVHLYDGDELENHNVFRAPGAARMSELKARPNKTDYYRKRYSPMRRKIFSHPEFVSENNISQLGDFDFVFICIDSGKSRQLIAEYLVSNNIPFIDCGIDVSNRAETNLLEGSTRVTLVVDSGPKDALSSLSFGELHDPLYESNIQIAELNALNAAQAVIEWKKWLGFYANDRPNAFQATYDSQDNRMVRG